MSTTPPTPPAVSGPTPPSPPKESEGLTEGQKKALVVGGVVAAIVLLALAVWAAYALVNNPAQAATVRDVFIIFMALETMVIGAALVVLIVQVAVLTNLLKNEIKPILEATQETVNTVRGTTIFVSEHLVEPVMKLNSYVAGLDRLLESVALVMGLSRRKK
ncbi:MAG TPA: hypothetical protein VI793_11465 [Anaerolineales bacterium]|nr:hypothetical protein [Anaerolineales bacterium]